MRTILLVLGVLGFLGGGALAAKHLPFLRQAVPVTAAAGIAVGATVSYWSRKRGWRPATVLALRGDGYARLRLAENGAYVKRRLHLLRAVA